MKPRGKGAPRQRKNPREEPVSGALEGGHRRWRRGWWGRRHDVLRWRGKHVAAGDERIARVDVVPQVQIEGGKYGVGRRLRDRLPVFGLDPAQHWRRQEP